MLAIANIKKAKSSTFGVFTLLLVAAMLLNIGVTMLDVGNFFDHEMERLNAPHIAFAQNYNLEGNPKIEFLQNHNNVTNVSYSRALLNMGSVRDHTDTPFVGTVIFISYDNELEGNQAILPLGTFLLSGHEVGNNFGVDFGGQVLHFTLQDTFIHHLLDNPNAFPRGFYTAYEYFNYLWSLPQHAKSQYYLIYATLYDASGINSLISEYFVAFSEHGIFSYTIDEAREARIMIPSVIAIFLFAFSVILIVVSIVVIRFRIVNSIEESMKNIGVLKSLGFQSRTIISAYVMQFEIIALVAGVVGAGLSIVVTPLLATISEPMLGLYWVTGFNPLLCIISVVAIVGIVSLFVYLSASFRVRTLFPITALRGGLKNHNFVKNHLSLSKFYAPLNMQIALKAILQNKKQAVAMVIISTALTFSAAFGVMVLYNMQINTRAFIGMVGGEMFETPDIVITVTEDNDQVRNRLISHPNVESLYRFDFDTLIMINGILTRASVFEDANMFSDQFVLEGRIPIYANEMAINRPSAIEFGAGVGSWLYINEEKFLVTAIARDIEGVFNPGAVFTAEAGRNLMPDFEFTHYAIVLNDHGYVKAFDEYVQYNFSHIVPATFSVEIQGDMIMDAIAPPFTMVSSVIVVSVFFVIIMVLYLIIKTTILRSKKDLGIQKAMGFTSFMLMKQIAFSLTPVIFVGAAFGIVLGFVFINPLLGQLMIGIGLEPGDMFLPLEYMFGSAAGVIGLSYAISLAVASKIRSISAYEMVTE